MPSPARAEPPSSPASASALPLSVPTSVTSWPPARARVPMPRAMLPVPTIVTCMVGFLPWLVCDSGVCDDEHGGAGRVAREQAAVAVLDRRTQRGEPQADRGELVRVRDDERPVPQADRVRRRRRRVAPAPHVDADV